MVTGEKCKNMIRMGAHPWAGRDWQHAEQLEAEAAGGAGRSSACDSSSSHRS